MDETNLDRTILLATGVTLRAEHKDRPLAYHLADEIRQRLSDDSTWRPLVISDVLYLNDKRLSSCPVISVGGPGLNQLSAMLFEELPAVLSIDNTLIIQMDLEFRDMRCCLWGMNHDQTVEALELFLKRGYLDLYLDHLSGKPA
jgi:hypothetical protein